MAITINGTNGLTTDNGALKLDTDTLVVDDTNNRVGIGTSSPSTRLTVSSSGANGLDLAVDQGNAVASARLFFTNGTAGQGYSISNDTGSLKFNRAATAGSSTGTESMRIDSSGRVTMPYQPAFNAGRTAGHVSNAVVLWDSIGTNVGSHYSAATGRFTAPVAGNYFFIANAICGSSGYAPASGSLQLRVNGSSIKDSHWNMSDPWENLSTLAVVTLNTNDYVDVYVSGNFMVGTGIFSQFNGYIIG
jgi:hypothetical protein